MVTPVTSLSKNGLSDWIIQRFSAVIITVYVLFLLYFFIQNPQLDYSTWKSLFDNQAMKIFSLLTLVSLLAHSWIGLWVVITDYLTTRLMGAYANVCRIFCLFTILVLSLIMLILGIDIFWG